MRAIARRPPLGRTIGAAWWATIFMALMLMEAIVRMGARAAAVIDDLEDHQVIVLVVVVAAFGYFEGYRALQQRFAPAFVSRAFAAGHGGGRMGLLTAPLFACSLIGAPPRELARAWAGVSLIILAALSMRMLPPVWRGIVDAGVAGALAWGLIAIARRFVQELQRREREVSPDDLSSS